MVTATATLLYSVVVPVYNGGSDLKECVAAIQAAISPSSELIVVDDGSTDGSFDVAKVLGARVFSTGTRKGPGAARNVGAQHAQGEYLIFIDADCLIRPDTLSKLQRLIRSNPEIDAVFGSYDDAPRDRGLISQYKNLSHHYVHQVSSERASTFWAGCGCIKRSLFFQLGGFDTERFCRPSIEDIHLGYRAKLEGANIYLAKDIQVSHLKKWTLSNLIKTDVLRRGVPWTRLLLANRQCRVYELNLRLEQRLSVIAACFLPLAAFISIWFNEAALLVVSSSILLYLLNRNFYMFLASKRGVPFTIACLPLHCLYFLYSGLSFALAFFQHCLDKTGAYRLSTTRTPLKEMVLRH
jgi:glycosyltransferase involved in cell wall biosynthesis